MPAGAASERVPGHLCVHVGVAVDKARRDDHALGVDHFVGGAGDPSDLGNPPLLYTDIRAVSGHAGPVHYGTVPDEKIERHRALPGLFQLAKP